MILFERGRIVDEYLSVPEFYGPLPPGRRRRPRGEPDGRRAADGRRSGGVRRVARTAPSPADLPPARELLAELAAAASGSRARARLGRRARARGRREDRARVKVLLLHALARLASGCGIRRSRRCVTPATIRQRLTCTAAGRRSTTGRRSSCGTSTARSSSSARRWAATARSRSRAGRPSAILGMVLVGLDGRRRYVRAPPRAASEVITELRGAAPAASADEDADLEHLAVAQEAMRDRLDLSGVVASFGGPLLVCVGDGDELVSVDEARQLADSALDGIARGLSRSRALRRASTSPTGSTQSCSSSSRTRWRT